MCGHHSCYSKTKIEFLVLPNQGEKKGVCFDAKRPKTRHFVSKNLSLETTRSVSKYLPIFDFCRHDPTIIDHECMYLG